ncbi:MAG TPA: hypothetical protein VFH42_05855, partial [Sporolactobacillaceae bacterium]|nr:hypothetical protein [Sporolactobacillaceae bacterium]
GLVNHPLNAQDLEEGDDAPALEPDFKPSLTSDQVSFDMNEMFTIASQMMSDPEFLESLSGMFNGVNQEELTEEVMSFPINLPGILNLIGGPPSGLTGGISPTDFSQLVSTLFQELNDLREQIQDMNENLLELREELTHFIKKNKQDPDSLFG